MDIKTEILKIKLFVSEYIQEWGYCFKPFTLKHFAYKLRCDGKSFQLEYINTSMTKHKDVYFNNIEEVFNTINIFEQLA